MYSERDYLPISALQHLLFCQRQCALMLLENQWRDNRLTILGSLLHKKAHKSGKVKFRDRSEIRSLPVFSRRLGLYGILDVLTMTQSEAGSANFNWSPREYKRGKPKKNPCDRVQLCAQAICLEEMSIDPEFARFFESPIRITQGQIFYGTTKRAVDVPFTPELRELTIGSAARLHELIESGRTPMPENGPKCRNCSLRDVCLPELGDRFATVTDYLDRAYRRAFAAD
ncbi:hypothetical protein FGO68_gene11357 [Halteria grandinella]|uniref:5' to 3' exodeoxyribonuclease (nucleoside 3'-phosphate-forming) n=1 Tax=Halteria grandinella TaxID=5974 RepID=A0A8J8SUW8_HALGN|nr:hypothetical protein FGO68_gene11357 [Halteria grandinella]